jgi:hypothetical protein
MTTQPQETPNYEVIVWDYDAAPDAAEWLTEDCDNERLLKSIAPYYCSRRVSAQSLAEAKSEVQHQVDDKCRVGAAVFLNGAKVYGLGLVFPYRARYSETQAPPQQCGVFYCQISRQDRWDARIVAAKTISMLK